MELDDYDEGDSTEGEPGETQTLGISPSNPVFQFRPDSTPFYAKGHVTGTSSSETKHFQPVYCLGVLWSLFRMGLRLVHGQKGPKGRSTRNPKLSPNQKRELRNEGVILEASFGVYFGENEAENCCGKIAPCPWSTETQISLIAILHAYRAINQMATSLSYQIFTDNKVALSYIDEASEGRRLLKGDDSFEYAEKQYRLLAEAIVEEQWKLTSTVMIVIQSGIARGGLHGQNGARRLAKKALDLQEFYKGVGDALVPLDNDVDTFEEQTDADGEPCKTSQTEDNNEAKGRHLSDEEFLIQQLQEVELG